MRWTIALVIVVCACAVAQAEVYEWVDLGGVTHFTDDLDKVPARYRDKVKRRESVAGEKGTAAPEASPAAPAPAESQLQVEMYGGHDEVWWRSRYKDLRDEMKKIQDGLPEKREALSALHRRRMVYQEARDRVAYYDKKAEIERDEARIKELEQKLADLDAEATRLGVPFAWRR